MCTSYKDYWSCGHIRRNQLLECTNNNRKRCRSVTSETKTYSTTCGRRACYDHHHHNPLPAPAPPTPLLPRLIRARTPSPEPARRRVRFLDNDTDHDNDDLRLVPRAQTVSPSRWLSLLDDIRGYDGGKERDEKREERRYRYYSYEREEQRTTTTFRGRPARRRESGSWWRW